MALLVGHSHAKYFHQYLRDSSIQTLSYSGSKIEELWPKIKDIVTNFKVIAIHTGANNLPLDEADDVLEKYEELCNLIHTENPSCQILLSAILPRVQSGFDNKKSDQFLHSFNTTATSVNETLRRVTRKMRTTSLVEFPEYVVRGQIQKQLLSKDGLHLSFQGTKYVVSTIEEQIHRTLRDVRRRRNM